MSIIETIIMTLFLLVGVITVYYGIGKQNILCHFGHHRPDLSEMSYNFETREISIHCKVCQKVAYKVKSEDQLTDEQWCWFRKIFEDF